jgi:hypothetical protein
MKFIIFFNHVEEVWEGLDEATRARHQETLAGLIGDLAAKQKTKMIFFAAPSAARTVRQYPDGHQETLTGPSRPGPEQPGGYYVIEADSIDDAVEWARRGRFLTGSNEVREIIEFPG